MKEMFCIVCPNGCRLQTEEKDGCIKVSGNLCKRGEDFAVSELTHPMRIVCSTAATVFPGIPVIPVRVSREIPRERIFDVMAEINKITVDAPVKRGGILIKNVLGLGADVIAASSILMEAEEGAEKG